MFFISNVYKENVSRMNQKGKSGFIEMGGKHDGEFKFFTVNLL